MKHMNVLYLVPAGILGFLGGAAFAGPSRKGLSMKKPSPLGPGIPLASWERFVAVMVVTPKGQPIAKRQVSPKRKYGMFSMGPRRLQDIGLMSGVVRGHDGWTGQWKAPLTEDAFLGNLPLQYAAFSNSMKAMAPLVSGSVGVEVDGVRCSLSGLLGVAHMAGVEGCLGWTQSPQARRKFGETTAVFQHCNGIF
jgi:hypothetical protein